mgnify:FL=1
MRIVSLLPSTTEIVVALGMQDHLVGRSHECDYPEQVTSLPACTQPKFEPDGSSYEIDQRVKALLQEGLSVYRVNQEQLAALEPDLIITQDHCKVCAASVDEVKEAVHNQLGNHVEVLSVSPTDLSGVVSSIRTIAEAIGAEEAAQKLTDQMKTELQQIQEAVIELRRPNVLAIEWMKPLMSAGNWMPQLIQLAGGKPLAAETGEHSPQINWDDIRRRNPDIITIMPCGYTLDQTLAEIPMLTDRPGWDRLRAVQNKQIYLLDGHQYFNRPGPRLVDSTRILAEVLHPSIFRKNGGSQGWLNLWRHQFHQQIK